MDEHVLRFIGVLSSIVVGRSGGCRIAVSSKSVEEGLSSRLSGDRVSIGLASGDIASADILYTRVDVGVDEGVIAGFDGVLLVDGSIVGVYRDPLLVKSLVSRGFVRSWVPVGSGLALLARRGFDEGFLRGTIEVYRDSFIRGPNPIHYNTAYFLYIIAKLATRYYSGGAVVEVGTGRGFSTLWLAQACRETGCRVVSYDVSLERIGAARMFLDRLGLGDYVDLRCCDARRPCSGVDEVNILFIDGKKNEYLDYLKAFEQHLIRGAVIIAHNTISNSDLTAGYIHHVYRRYKSITLLTDPAGITLSVNTPGQ